VSRIVLIVLLAAGVLAGVIVAARIGPANFLGMIRYDQRKAGKLKVGERAPDVELLAIDGKTPARLSEHLGGRPYVVVFGSFT
jgi:hypothetical protein